MKKPLVIHPFLFALYFILFLFAYNIHEILFSQIMFPLAVVLGFTFLFMWLSKIIFKDNIKEGIIVSLFLVMFFSYGHIYDIIGGARLGNFLIGRNIYILPMWIIIFICINYFIIKKQQKSLCNFTKILNVIAFTLVLISLFNIGIYKFNLITNVQDKNIYIENRDSNIVGLEHKKPLRDIYYIILDEYASSRTLNEIYKYDNSEFTDYLINEEFYIATKSQSNYAYTFPSIASSLNMEYINNISSMISGKVKVDTILFQMIQNSKVMRFLKSKGYKFILFSSGYGATDYNKLADLNIRGSARFNEFFTLLIKTTVLEPITRYISGGIIKDRILGTFSKLGELDQIREPKFVFAHIVCPHYPYVFKANGDPVEVKLLTFAKGLTQSEDRELYLSQLIFITKKVKVLVNEILLKSEVSPIIILQADHGTAFGFNDCEHPTEEMFKGRMNIFNVYYLPGGGNEVLYNSITPVNTFRLIFNYYFGMDYKLLKDRSYFLNPEIPHEYIDVTDKVKYN
jgi:hypothetical protein